MRFLECFAANIRNKNTRRAYAQAVHEFLAWCESAGIASIGDVKPLHIAAYVEQLGRERSAPTVKQRLAAIRHLFDWFVTGQAIATNPAAAVRGSPIAHTFSFANFAKSKTTRARRQRRTMPGQAATDIAIHQATAGDSPRSLSEPVRDFCGVAATGL